MSGQLIVEFFNDRGENFRTLVNYDPLNVDPFLAIVKEWGVEDKEGETYKFKSARVDLGSVTPRLDIFLIKEI